VRPEDHTIKTKLDAPEMINCKVYPLMKPEREATQRFIEENKALGFIEKTDSPWSMLWFFIKKKDGSLRPVQDYREVNKWTICDVYPIPCLADYNFELVHKPGATNRVDCLSW
jgi:Integrase zinc binding domain